MPISYTIEKAAGLVRTRCYGEVTLAEVLNHFQILKDDPDRASHVDVLLDLRDVIQSPTADQIREASHGLEVLSGTLSFGYCAIVASRDVVFGLARMWAVFVERLFTQIEVFRSATEAEIWLTLQRAGRRTAQTS